MHKFEYEIRLNEENQPYIYIPEEYVNKPEDKFMALELTRYILQQLIATRKNTLDEQTMQSLESSYKSLSKISEEVGEIIKEMMETMGDAYMHIKANYHAQVQTIDERNSLNYKGFINNGKILRRVEGLRILVAQENKVYELQGGIDNENWKEIYEF